MTPLAWAGRKPGCSPKMVSNCWSRSWASATIFSSVGRGITPLLSHRGPLLLACPNDRSAADAPLDAAPVGIGRRGADSADFSTLGNREIPGDQRSVALSTGWRSDLLPGQSAPGHGERPSVALVASI